MKQLIFLTAIGIAFAFTDAGRPARAADAVFSYSLQGAKISGGEVDAVQISNIAAMTSSDKGKKLSFFLNDAYNSKADAYSHSLRFAIPGKTGSVAFKDGDDNWSVQLFVAAGADGKYNLYGNEDFTVTVSNLSAMRVSGTFSGKVKGVSGKTDELVITDGKFDIPIRNEGR